MGQYLPVLLLLARPLMMIFMMRGMGGNLSLANAVDTCPSWRFVHRCRYTQGTWVVGLHANTRIPRGHLCKNASALFAFVSDRPCGSSTTSPYPP